MIWQNKPASRARTLRVDIDRNCPHSSVQRGKQSGMRVLGDALCSQIVAVVNIFDDRPSLFVVDRVGLGAFAYKAFWNIVLRFPQRMLFWSRISSRWSSLAATRTASVGGGGGGAVSGCFEVPASIAAANPATSATARTNIRAGFILISPVMSVFAFPDLAQPRASRPRKAGARLQHSSGNFGLNGQRQFETMRRRHRTNFRPRYRKAACLATVHLTLRHVPGHLPATAAPF
jgi:hypothetical protein